VQTVISCPGCGVPAEIADRFSLPSTDGPVEHVVVDCAAGHHYRMAADRPRFPDPGGTFHHEQAARSLARRRQLPRITASSASRLSSGSSSCGIAAAS
jgi:hypothetical protein